MKGTVLYHSRTGNTRKMAEIIAEGMERVSHTQARAMSIEEVDEEWLKESVCIVVGSPIYHASMSGEMKVFLEKMGKYGIAGKLGGAFATANYIHGGGELGIQAILDHLLVYGMLVYSGGGSQGKPVIHLGPVAIAGRLEESRETFELYGQRMAQKAAELFEKV